MSQLQPSVIEGEKHPSWLIEHLDGIKFTLKKELTDLHGDGGNSKNGGKEGRFLYYSEKVLLFMNLITCKSCFNIFA